MSSQSWALVYKRAGHRLAWLIIENVPTTTTRAQLAQALEDSGADRRYAPGLGGTLAILPQPRWGTLEGLDRADHLTWTSLTPAEKRLTLRLTGPTHAQLTRAARRRGQDLQNWASTALQTAADTELDQKPQPAAPHAPQDTQRAPSAPTNAPLPRRPLPTPNPLGPGHGSHPVPPNHQSANPTIW